MRHRRRNGQYDHEFYWVDATPEYGLLLADPDDPNNYPSNTPYAAGNLCYGCGKWEGPPLKRGEARRFLARLRASQAVHG